MTSNPAVAALLASASEGGGGGLTDINFGLTIWTVVLFALFAFVMTKLGWKPLMNIIEEREKSIKVAVDSAHQASSEAQALLIEHKEILRDAGRQREDIVKKAISEADQLRADLQAHAKAEAERMLERAKAQIEQEKRQALEEIRSQVADLAIHAAAKIVTSSLTPEAQKRLVNDFIETLPRA
ncbi:MAG TPA: F0F1 ATP synthase subunit B [Vicinamibacteria bacterium]|nr:F0F1 ATP synthase subunit B [Vicinamibacteria bacterium]